MKDLSEQTSICEAIRSRRSCRAYLDQEVSLDTIQQILDAARWAPSGVNHQPARVAVLGKETKRKLANILVEKHLLAFLRTRITPSVQKSGPMFIKIDASNVVLLFTTPYLSL